MTAPEDEPQADGDKLAIIILALMVGSFLLGLVMLFIVG
jgi:hypothetical protein